MPLPKQTDVGDRAVYELTDVSWRYGQAANVVQNFSWTVGGRQRWGIVGPSGCGKTTLLSLLGGLKAPQRGQVLFHGSPARAPMREVSFIQQHYGLFDWKTVAQNLALPLVLQGRPRARVRSAVADQVNRLGLSGLEDQYPAQLSGGQRQRVAIGRALITRPEVLLMDEPFSALDALTRENLQQEVLKLSQETGVTLVLVTHSIEEAVLVCNHLLIFCCPGANPLALDNTATPRDRTDSRFVDMCAKIRSMLEVECL
jgi:ABC-type nitrate/sulfonate/bicarbonate transport system ATPase subunit